MNESRNREPGWGSCDNHILRKKPDRDTHGGLFRWASLMWQVPGGPLCSRYDVDYSHLNGGRPASAGWLSCGCRFPKVERGLIPPPQTLSARSWTLAWQVISARPLQLPTVTVTAPLLKPFVGAGCRLWLREYGCRGLRESSAVSSWRCAQDLSR